MTRFLEALLSSPCPVIAEVKPRDGAGTDLLNGRHPAQVASSYHQAGAACLSVVTGRWFGGTTHMLRQVCAATDLPVLQKDFITRPAHLRMAAELGASAVLLTARLLAAATLRRLTEQALLLGLTPFVEVTSEPEIDAVAHPGDCVIAVNNKDIQRRETGPADRDRSHRLLPAALATGTPCPVSASGIAGPDHAAQLLATGYAGLLVGTALLRTGDPAAWLAQLAAHRGDRSQEPVA